MSTQENSPNLNNSQKFDINKLGYKKLESKKGFKYFKSLVTGDKSEAPSENTADNQRDESQSLLSQIKSTWRSGIQKVSITSQLQAKKESWTYFCFFFLVGLLFIFLSFVHLPLLILSPQKFTLLFSLGSMFIIAALATFKGPTSFCQGMFSKEKWKFSAGYFFSLFGTIYFALFRQSYIFVCLLALGQLVALAWLISATIPGGISGMKFITKQFFNILTFLWNKCLKKQESTNFLPI